MQKACRKIILCWGSTCRLKSAAYLWILAMFGILALMESNRLGLYLIPPFAATLTIILVLPDAAVAQPYAVVAGSVVGASLGTLVSLFSGGGISMAIVAAVLAFVAINLLHAYHPP